MWSFKYVARSRAARFSNDLSQYAFLPVSQCVGKIIMLVWINFCRTFWATSLLSSVWIIWSLVRCLYSSSIVCSKTPAWCRQATDFGLNVFLWLLQRQYSCAILNLNFLESDHSFALKYVSHLQKLILVGTYNLTQSLVRVHQTWASHRADLIDYSKLVIMDALRCYFIISQAPQSLDLMPMILSFLASCLSYAFSWETTAIPLYRLSRVYCYNSFISI